MTDPNASGWHPDPAGVHHQRYWAGDGWTTRVADAYGVIAVHHLDGEYSPPGGGPVIPASAPPRPAAPALSLVAPAEEAPPVPEPIVVEAPAVAPPLVAPPAAVEPVVVEAPPPWELPRTEPVLPTFEPPPPPVPEIVIEPPLAARAAGWYPDPSGVHCERSWDGSAWSAVVVDRNRFVLEHTIRERYPAPVVVAAPQPAASARRVDLVAGVGGLDPGGDGWQLDPTGPCRERYVVGGLASSVVRTARGRIG